MTTETGAAGAAELGLILMSRAAGDANTADGDLARLIKLSKAGDLTAFEQIMRLHDRRVFRTALRLLRRIEDAEDASRTIELGRVRFYLRLPVPSDLKNPDGGLTYQDILVERNIILREGKTTVVGKVGIYGVYRGLFLVLSATVEE